MNVTRIVAAFVAAGLVAGSAMAQTKAPAPVQAPQDDVMLKQGTILYGGTIGWTISNMNDSGNKAKQNTLDIAPEANYFVIDNLSVGLRGDINWQRYKYDGETDNFTSMTLDLVGRYYMPLCNNKIIPFVGASVGGGYGMADYKLGTVEGHDNTFLTTYGFETGFLVPLNNSVMLDTTLAWRDIQRQGGEFVGAGAQNNNQKDESDVMLKMGFLIKL